MGRAFVVHYPHKLDKWKKEKILQSDVRQERFDNIFGSFQSFLAELPSQERVPLCTACDEKDMVDESAVTKMIGMKKAA